MARAPARSILALSGPVLGLGLLLAGCSPSATLGNLPTEVGGLPSNAPKRPGTAYQYPAVYDTPPPRDRARLTDEQQLEMEKRLQAIRDKQKSKADSDTEIKGAAPTASASNASAK